MMTILKRTTAIAALAALPLAPIAASAQSTQSDAESRPEAQDGLSDQQSSTGTSAGASESADKSGAATATQETEAGAAGTQDQASDTAAGATDDADTSSGQQAESGTPPTGDAAEADDVTRTKGAMQAEESAERGAAQSDDATQAEGSASGTAGTAQDGTMAGEEGDVVVARVGDADIMRSDVMSVIGTLPPNMQEQPAETLIPLAVEQLVLRELILQQAREAELENDPDVDALLAGTPDAPEEARENAMVQVWLDRELEGAVTDQAVEDTYGQVQSQLGDQAPPLEEIRPQIEQEVRRQAFLGISDELQSGAEVTLFGPDGEPIE